jgi:hypothetical protein
MERRDEVVRMELGSVDRRLQVQAEVDVAEECMQRPLLLLVAARRAPGEVGAAVSQRNPR